MGLSVAELPLESIAQDETRRFATPGLLASLREYGLLVPVIVRAHADGTYEMVNGNQRLAAARQLSWRAITAIVQPAAEANLPKDLAAILMNQSSNLEQIYLARHARRLLKERGCSQNELARQLGISQPNLSRMLQVIACEALETAVRRDGLAFSAAKALLPLLPGERKQLLRELREIAAREGQFPSVRQVEELVRQRQGHAPLVEVSLDNLSEAVAALESRGVTVEIRTVRAKQSAFRITVALSEAEAIALQQCLFTAAAADRKSVSAQGEGSNAAWHKAA